MANRYANLEGSKKISEDFPNINIGFDRVQAEMDTKGTPADAQAKADAAKTAAIAAAAADLTAHKARGADEHPTAKGNAAGFMSAADKLKSDASTSASTPDTLMQRDEAGRAKVTAPIATDDIARKAETDAVQANLDSHASDTNIHVTAADHTKLNGIAAGAEVNQNAFAVINDVEASSKSDTVTFEGGTGITVTTDPEGKRIVLTATGEATPGAHASSHITGGTDVIPDAVIGGSSGLMSGADAKFVRQDGESKTGAQAKADAAEQAANEYTDQKVGEIVIDDASLTQKGITQLSSATGSDSEFEAATPKAVNTVRKQADAKIGNLSELQTTDKDNLVDALNEVFQSGSEFKGDIADAITAKGVPTSATDNKVTFVQNIESIETSTVINGQQKQSVIYGEALQANDPVTTQDFLINNTSINGYPTGTGRAASWTPDGMYLAVAHNVAPFLAIYKSVEGEFIKLANPAVLPPNTATDAEFSSDGNYLAVSHAEAPYVTFYKRSGDVFTKLANPSISPGGTAWSLAWSPDGLYVAVGTSSSPFLTIYKRSGDVFTRNPLSFNTPPGTSYGLAWSPDGVYLAVACGTTPFAITYKRSGDTFTKLGDPQILPSPNPLTVAWQPNGSILVFAGTSSSLALYEMSSSDLLVKLPNPDVMPSGPVSGSDFSPDGKILSIAYSGGANIMSYKISDKSSYKLPDPAVLPSGNGDGIRYSPDGKYLAFGYAASNFLMIYRTAQKARKSGNLLADLKLATAAGYALESGATGETKDIITLWRE
ncbi:tail fiber protein [Paenibacillus sp. 1A_MP2]|uniref:tail fiber protein n=1 Tax=Paenibacillus sp. 1A_MP2 TaxID=3457495 RepID=UPI003FCE1A44